VREGTHREGRRHERASCREQPSSNAADHLPACAIRCRRQKTITTATLSEGVCDIAVSTVIKDINFAEYSNVWVAQPEPREIGDMRDDPHE
jgi:hypothetical protein